MGAVSHSDPSSRPQPSPRPETQVDHVEVVRDRTGSLVVGVAVVLENGYRTALPIISMEYKHEAAKPGVVTFTLDSRRVRFTQE